MSPISPAADRPPIISREYQRGGSAAGAIYAGAEKLPVERLRVRRQAASGAYEEVPLASYPAARAGRELKAAILRALECGVSTRKQSRLNSVASTALLAVS